MAKTSDSTGASHLARPLVQVFAPAEFGGLETVVEGIARGVRARGLALTLIPLVSSRLPLFLERLASEGFDVRPIACAGRSVWWRRKALLHRLDDLRPAVIHTHGYEADLLVASTAWSRRGVTTVHGFTSHTMKLRVYEALQRAAFRRLAAVVAVSEPLLHRLSTTHGAKVSLIRNGLSRPRAATSLTRGEARLRLGLSADALVIGWVGRFSAEKAPAAAVAALAAARLDAAILCMVGDGPERPAVERAAGIHGVSARLRLVGAIPEASALLPAFDALLLSSTTEGTPMTLLEAAVARVPIVATEVGGVPALVGDDAFLAPAGDSVALGRALASCLADSGLAASRAAALAARISHVGDSWIEEYLSLYVRVADVNRSP